MGGGWGPAAGRWAGIGSGISSGKAKGGMLRSMHLAFQSLSPPSILNSLARVVHPPRCCLHSARPCPDTRSRSPAWPRFRWQIRPLDEAEGDSSSEDEDEEAWEQRF